MVAVLVAALAGSSVVACGSKDKKKVKDPSEMTDDSSMGPKIDPTLCETENKEVERFDLNRDGKTDVWKLHKLIEIGGTTTRVPTCKQVDLDHDGQKDYVVAFNDKGGLVFEKIDLTFDGSFDAFHKYEEQKGDKDSLLYEIQRDSDFDGKYDVTEKYCVTSTEVEPCSPGDLIAVQRDTDGDRKPDVWEQYERGELVAILYDDEPRDGKVDRREEVAPKTPTPAPTAPAPTTAAPTTPAATAPAAGGTP
jgi:hypothetical protein